MKPDTVLALGLLALTALVLGGCVHAAGGVAPSNIPIHGSYQELGRVTGNDCAFRLLGIIPISGSNNTDQALAEALEQKPNADALVNITIDSWRHFWILWSSDCTEVDATAVKLN